MLNCIVEFSTRLELIEEQSGQIIRDYAKQTGNHLDRLIKRQLENETFTREVEAKKKKLAADINSFRQDLATIARVLSVSSDKSE